MRDQNPLGLGVDPPTAARLLGSVECVVGSFQQEHWIGLSRGRHGDPYACSDVDRNSSCVERTGERVRDALGKGLGTAPFGDWQLKNHEFVSAKARHDVVGANDGGEPLADLAEQLIAHGMAVEVVHGLETIEIDGQQGKEGTLAAEVVEREFEAAPVHEPGERVDFGKATQLPVVSKLFDHDVVLLLNRAAVSEGKQGQQDFRGDRNIIAGIPEADSEHEQQEQALKFGNAWIPLNPPVDSDAEEKDSETA